MTGNVAQAIVDPSGWQGTLRGASRVLRPGGHLVFETRDPAFRGWTEWNRRAVHRAVAVDGVGVVERSVDLVDIDWPLVTFRGTYVFHDDRTVLASESTLRFRERSEVEADLMAHGFDVVDVRDAPDRPGREFVFLARRS